MYRVCLHDLAAPLVSADRTTAQSQTRLYLRLLEGFFGSNAEEMVRTCGFMSDRSCSECRPVYCHVDGTEGLMRWQIGLSVVSHPRLGAQGMLFEPCSRF